MEILTAYIRENAPASIAQDPPMLPRNDIQAAITVIGRRSETLRALEITTDADGDTAPIRLDLRGTCLQGTDMQGRQFDNARFDGSRMEETLLTVASLDGAMLNEARLTGADLTGAVLNGAGLNWAGLNWAVLNWAVLNGARLNGAILNEAMLDGTDFTAAHTRLAAVKSADLSVSVNLLEDQVKSMFGDATTTLPKGVTPPDWHAEELDMGEFLKRWEATKKADWMV